MKPRISATVGLLLLATCTGDFADQSSPNRESAAKGIGTVPPTEVAVWQKVSSSSLPDGRYLQALAFDENRRVVVMFGGMTYSPNMGTSAPNGETWEWDPKTGKWTNRTGAGTSPEPRSGASLAYDSVNKKMVLFGGRAGSGYNLEDTWEWEPTAGTWTNVSAAGGHPSARCQHGMVYEKGSAKFLLFGGGRSDINSYDGTGILASFGDTWEYDPNDHTWKQLTVTATPTARHAFGFAWNSAHSTAVLFGGMQTDIPNAPGIPKQDTWEWNPTTATWTERTGTGSKPSQRYGHAMAFDGKGGKVLLFGGLDVSSSGGSLNDLWELDPTTYAWTRRLTGAEGGVPSGRMYASLVSDDVGGVLELIAGYSAYNQWGTGGSYGYGGMYDNYGGMYGGAGAETAGAPGSAGADGAGGMDGYAGSSGGGPVGPMYPSMASREVWELDPSKPKFTERSAPLDVPSSRVGHATVYNPQTGKTMVFGGYDSFSGQPLNDLWEWDGKAWAQVAVDARPSARSDGALAYDPARKSLILYGGMDYNTGSPLAETWEFGANRKWTQLKPLASPEPLYQHGMATDTTRGKILLFGGMTNYWDGTGRYKDPMRQDVWEWDGTAVTWTKRSAPTAGQTPYGGYSVLSYDEGQQKLFVFDNGNTSMGYTSFWEWSPITTGWENRNFGDSSNLGYALAIAYDSIRRRQVLLAYPNTPAATVTQETWEIDTRRPTPTLYVRNNVPGPGSVSGAGVAFDSARGVVVLFGGQDWNTGMGLADTWEYKVTNLANGEGCTAAFASSCATGFCVEGVCCETAACSGACKSCSVPGSEGTCVLAAPGTEVPGSCPAATSCDATGTCKPKNGQPCTAATECASGFCVEGVCCDSACTGNCKSCNQAGRAGQCTPYTAGTDPKGQCGLGTGTCKSTCDGNGACVFPQTNVSCGDCLLCNGSGDCSMYDYSCPIIIGGAGGRPPYPTGGSGGYVPTGGSGGYIPTGGRGGYSGGGGAIGGSGGTPPRGGSGGSTAPVGGRGGTTASAGSGGTVPVKLDGGLPSTGGIDGGPVPSGTGGAISGTGGDTGLFPKLDAAGSGGPEVGGVFYDAGTAASLGKSGCSCELGGQTVSRAGTFTLFLALGIAIPLWRRRRRS